MPRVPVPVRFTALLACLLFPLALWAQAAGDSPLRTLGPGAGGGGWGAVGRLNLDARGFCTATLVTPDRVLTAAHCLFDHETGARIDDGTIEFLAGWRIGHAEAIRGIRRAAIAPGYFAADPRSWERVAHDLALLELDRPVGLAGVQPFGVSRQPPVPGASVALVSYARGREGAPSLQEACGVLNRLEEGVLVMSCDIDSGSSGAPVFALERGVPRIVSVISAQTESGGRKLALGMLVDGQFAALMAELDRPQEPARRLRPTAAEGGAGARTTARFLRP